MYSDVDALKLEIYFDECYENRLDISYNIIKSYKNSQSKDKLIELVLKTIKDTRSEKALEVNRNQKVKKMKKKNKWDKLGLVGMGIFAIISLITLNYLWILPGVLVRFIFIVIDLWQQPTTYINTDKTPHRRKSYSEEDHFIYHHIFNKKKQPKRLDMYTCAKGEIIAICRKIDKLGVYL